MRWAVWVVLVGCGRVDFDVVSDGAVPPAGDGSGAPLTCTAWGGVHRLDALATIGDDWDGAQHGTTIAFASNRSGMQRMYLGTTDNTFVRELTELNDAVEPTSGPAWSSDGATLYFASGRGTGLYHLFTASFSGGVFGTPVFVPGLETTAADSAAVAADGLEMFYDDSQTVAIGTLYRASRPSIAAAWHVDGPVSELLSGTGEGYPALSPDALTIWFESSREVAAGEIYTATRPDRTHPFGAVAKVAELDPTGTMVDSGDPDVDATGTQMLFAAREPGGAGGDDLYLATRTCR